LVFLRKKFLPLGMTFVFQQQPAPGKEFTMLNRTLLVLVIVAALFGTASSVTADEGTSLFHFDNAVFRGQNQSQKNASLFDRMRQGWNRFLADEDDNKSTHRPAPAVPPASQVQPPKPLTNADIQQSQATPNQGQRAGSIPAQQPQQGIRREGGGMLSATPRDSLDLGGGDENNASILDRMKTIRAPFFTDDVVAAAQHSRLPMGGTPRPTPPPSPADYSTGFAILSNESAGIPITSRPPVVADANPTQGTRNELVAPSQPDTARPVVPVEPVAPPQEPNRRAVVGVSPQLEVKVSKPAGVVINEEIEYRITVANIGNEPAERVVVNAEIPSWVEVRQIEATTGNVERHLREDGSGVIDLQWKSNRINQGVTETLILRVIPLVSRSIALRVTHSFERPAIVAEVPVREPKLELELLGATEVLWNTTAYYTLLIRNVGTGNAEKLRLDLLQTSSKASFYEFDEPMPPGDEQQMQIEVQVSKEQEHIDILVTATGAHNLKGEVKRRIKVLRPKLEMKIQTAPMHLVDDNAEIVVRIQNMGTADADHVNIRAELPLGAQYVSSSPGGMLAQQQQQNVVEWRGKSIERGDTQTFTLTCRPKREGDCRVSVEASEPGGTVLETGHTSFAVEAISELELVVLKPDKPIELGQEAEYEVKVTNIGTKAAENITVSMLFSRELEPVNVYGSDARHGDGLVVFDIIPVILPKECVALKVYARADQVGAAQVKTQVTGMDFPLENGLSTRIINRQKTSTATGQSSQNEFR
jgi:uncharacterized repeat protein (TIGR01451 family)